MRRVGVSEARRKLGQFVDLASAGERVEITQRGKLVAALLPPPSEMSLKEVFDDIEEVRKRSRKPRGLKVKSLIEEGRI